MFSESKVTESFCVADDFCKDFSLQEKKIYEYKKTRYRNKPNRMNDTDVKI